MNYYKSAICPICGKEFFPTLEWAYKKGSKRYCSYSCLNKSREGIKRRKGLRYVEQYTEDGELVRTYDSANNAADVLGCDPTTLRDACRGIGDHRALGYIFKYKKENKNEHTDKQSDLENN